MVGMKAHAPPDQCGPARIAARISKENQGQKQKDLLDAAIAPKTTRYQMMAAATGTARFAQTQQLGGSPIPRTR
jgi:hypothetical protein